MELRPSGHPPLWEAGQQITWRFRRKVPGYRGPETVHPVTVVRDDVEGLVAWLAAGTPVLRPVLPDGSELRSVDAVEMFTAGRAALRDRWRGPGILKIAPTGIEDAHLRSADAVYTQDHVLDLWVDAVPALPLGEQWDFDASSPQIGPGIASSVLGAHVRRRIGPAAGSPRRALSVGALLTTGLSRPALA